MREPDGTARRCRARRRRGAFYEWTWPRPEVTVDGRQLRGPVLYHPFETFRTIHLATAQRVRAVLPSADLEPVLWWDGRAAVVVAAMRYREITVRDVREGPVLVEPYGEVMVGALVTRGRRPRPLAALLPDVTGVGVFVLDLPVTTTEARDLGRSLWGLPKYVADMEFHDGAETRVVRLAEAGKEILRLSIQPGGRVVRSEEVVTLYSVRGTDLVETVMPWRGWYRRRWGGAAGQLVVGSDHPTADRLARLDVARRPLVALDFLDARAILPGGTTIGTARPYAGHVAGREDASLTVTFPGLWSPVREAVIGPGSAWPGADVRSPERSPRV
ncbi:acetoacetate decarboxylase family protein [Jatrophihabitans fulvus]